MRLNSSKQYFSYNKYHGYVLDVVIKITVLSSFMTYRYHRVCNKCNLTGACHAWSRIYLPFMGTCMTLPVDLQFFVCSVLQIIVYPFVLFLLVNVLLVLRFTASAYAFSIFKYCFKQYILCMGGNKIATGNTHIIDRHISFCQCLATGQQRSL